MLAKDKGQIHCTLYRLVLVHTGHYHTISVLFILMEDIGLRMFMLVQNNSIVKTLGNIKEHENVVSLQYAYDTSVF